MDPNATAAIMRDTTADRADRLAAATDLDRWLSRGGFPQSIPGMHFGGNTAARYAARQEVARYLAELNR
jgi:hypothetical protein